MIQLTPATHFCTYYFNNIYLTLYKISKVQEIIIINIKDIYASTTEIKWCEHFLYLLPFKKEVKFAKLRMDRYVKLTVKC